MKEYRLNENATLRASGDAYRLAQKHGVIEELKGKRGQYLLAADTIESIKVMQVWEGRIVPTEMSGFYRRDGDAETIMESSLDYMINELVPKLPDQLVPRVKLRPVWIKADYKYRTLKEAEGTMRTKIRATIEEGQRIAPTYAEFELKDTYEPITTGMRARTAWEALFTTRSLKDRLQGQIDMIGGTEQDIEHLTKIRQTQSALTRYLNMLKENPTEAFEIYLPVNDPGFSNSMWKNAFRKIFLESETAEKELEKMLDQLSRTKDTMESEEFEEPVEIIMMPRDRDDYTIIPEE